MKKSSKKGLKIAAITVGCIALAVAAGFGTYRIKNRIDSKNIILSRSTPRRFPHRRSRCAMILFSSKMSGCTMSFTAAASSRLY